jgi:hypothetical protein
MGLYQVFRLQPCHPLQGVYVLQGERAEVTAEQEQRP